MGDYGGGSGDYVGPYGYAWGSNEDLYNTFVGPFVDVFKTAVGKSKEIGVKARTLLNVSVDTILSTLIPFYGANYAKIFDKEAENIKKLREKYKDVYERTDKALGGSDAVALAFMASPALVTGAWAASKAPEAIKDLLSGLSGGASDDIYEEIKEKAIEAGRWSLGEDEKDREKRIRQKKQKRKYAKYMGKIDPKAFFGESQLNEDEQKKKEDITPEKVVKSKLFLSKVLEAPQVKELQKTATETYRTSLKEIYKQAQDVLKNSSSIEDLEKAAKKKIPEAENLKKLQGEERVKAEKILIDGVRKAMKEFYVKNLTDQVESVVSAGIPEGSQYVKEFRSVIQKIKAL